MFRIMKKVVCGKIICYQLLQESLWVLKVENSNFYSIQNHIWKKMAPIILFFQLSHPFFSNVILYWIEVAIQFNTLIRTHWYHRWCSRTNIFLFQALCNEKKYSISINNFQKLKSARHLKIFRNTKKINLSFFTEHRINLLVFYYIFFYSKHHAAINEIAFSSIVSRNGSPMRDLKKYRRPKYIYHLVLYIRHHHIIALVYWKESCKAPHFRSTVLHMLI